MAKQLWKPGNMIYPLPAVMVSVTDGEGHDNIITVAWTGTVCTNPAMAYDPENRRICDQSDNGEAGVCNGFLRGPFGT